MFVGSLSVEIHSQIAHELDLMSLFAWRDTCRYLYAVAVGAYLADLRWTVAQYLHDAPAFLELVTDTGAVLGGPSAVPILLRDRTFTPPALTIAVAVSAFDAFAAGLSLLNVRILRSRLPRDECPHGTLVCATPEGGRLLVKVSSTDSAVRRLMGSVYSALESAVSPATISCIWPLLTLDRRCLVADLEIDPRIYWTLPPNFSIARHPAAWADFNEPWRTSLPRPCLRRFFLCGAQHRYLGDGGSLHFLVDPIHTDMASWRDPTGGQPNPSYAISPGTRWDHSCAFIEADPDRPCTFAGHPRQYPTPRRQGTYPAPLLRRARGHSL